MHNIISVKSSPEQIFFSVCNLLITITSHQILSVFLAGENVKKIIIKELNEKRFPRIHICSRNRKLKRRILELISTNKCTRSFLISKFNEPNQQIKCSTFALTLEQLNTRTILIEGTKPVVRIVWVTYCFRCSVVLFHF